jgi:hypothetical protein
VTTGPVTVPLMLAVGAGVADKDRAEKDDGDATSDEEEEVSSHPLRGLHGEPLPYPQGVWCCRRRGQRRIGARRSVSSRWPRSSQSSR